MGCQVAVSVFPFHGGIGTRCAIPTGWIFGTTAATLALFDDLMANPLVVRTPFSGHKRALNAFFNGCTNHWNHPLEFGFVCIKKAGNRLDPAKADWKIPGNIMTLESIVNNYFAKRFEFFDSWSILDLWTLFILNKYSGRLPDYPTLVNQCYGAA